MVVKAKFVSSLEKVFLDSDYESIKSVDKLSFFKNERVSFQLVVSFEESTNHAERFVLRTDTTLGEYSLREVKSVPVSFAMFPGIKDGVLRTEPGLYPDVLIPLRYENSVTLLYNQLQSVFVTFDTDLAPGVHTFTAELVRGDTVYCSTSITLDIIDCELPKQETSFTQWFHYDALSYYYNEEMFSEKYFEILKNYVRTAVKNGINTLLTPVLTPAFDTIPGHDRLTAQLVRIEKDGNAYKFDFSLFEKFVKICRECGTERFEISPFFTQWGAAHAPKVMAYENGEYKKIFGWDTDSCSEEYRTFLRALIPALKEKMSSLGILKTALFHISDEPNKNVYEKYKAAKSGISDLLSDVKVVDALSDFEFYKSGIIDNPIPSIDHAEPFVDAEIDDLWVYYCSAQYSRVSNRFICMPSSRTRIIGIQMYKYNISGFLHWGYNFYNNSGSYDHVNPYLFTDGDNWVPAGDTYSVYPAQNGTAYESIRLCVFYDALQDIRALKLAESFIGRDAVLKLIEEGLEKPLTFKDYPMSPDYILNLRKKINDAVKEKLNG